MNAPQLARVSSAVCLVLWIGDDLVIARRGHPSGGWLDTVLFLGGAIAMIVALAALGASLFAGRDRPRRVAGALGAVLGGVLLTLLVQGLVVTFQPSHPGWAWGEINLWVLMTVSALIIWTRPSAHATVVSDSR